jgi:hypothetical protein
MAKGLCRKCGEKWHKGHTCATAVQLNVLHEIWDLFEPESMECQDSENSNSSPEQLCMANSEVAVSRSGATRIMKIKGVIQGLEILILIDSWSSHSFISD